MSSAPPPPPVRPAPGTRLVLVVDDDEVARAGIEGSLRSASSSLTVVGMRAAEALAATFDGLHAAIVESLDPTRSADQVVGVAVIEHLRRVVGPVRTVAVCSAPDDDPVRRRMAECGADRYLHRSWARRPIDVVRAVLDEDAPELAVPAVRDPEAMHRLGIGPASSVNRGVDAAIAEGLVPVAGWVGPRGRDRYARRIRFNQAARLRPVTAEGLDSEHGELAPSLRQIQRFHAWAAQVVEPVATTASDRHRSGEEPMSEHRIPCTSGANGEPAP